MVCQRSIVWLERHQKVIEQQSPRRCMAKERAWSRAGSRGRNASSPRTSSPLLNYGLVPIMALYKYKYRRTMCDSGAPDREPDFNFVAEGTCHVFAFLERGFIIVPQGFKLLHPERNRPACAFSPTRNGRVCRPGCCGVS